MKRGIAAAFVVFVLATACDDNRGSTPPEGARNPDTAVGAEPVPRAAKPKLELPGASIKLPAKPVFPKFVAPTRHPAGEWSIAGLREDIDRNVSAGDKGEEITLRATVQEIYAPPSCPTGDVCPPPKQPHIWVTDDPADKGKRRAMLVVNYRFQIPSWDAVFWKGEPEVELVVGEEYIFKGTFKRFSDTGFASDLGLLEFVAVHTTSAAGVETWVYPPGAAWHPKEIERVEKSNDALAE